MLASCKKNLAPPPPIPWQEQNVLETDSPNNTMNLSDQSSNGITRRNFMKKSALTVSAITLLGQGTGLASGSSSWFCNASCGGGVANTPFKRYWSLDNNGQTMYFEVGKCKCTNGHKFGQGTYMVNVMTQAQAEATLEGASGQAWGADPLPAKHIQGGCGEKH